LTLQRVTARRGFLLGAVIALLALILALRAAGPWLVTDDPLQPAKSVVVLGGQVPFRAMEAAAVYKQGWAPEVWLTQGAYTEVDAALDDLGIDRIPEHDYSRRVLDRLGVPDAAIRVLAERNVNTADEIRAVKKRLEAVAADRVIIVTSKSHTRRVKTLWRKLVGNHPEAIVRYAADDPFDPVHWWDRREDALSVSREWLGLLSVWIGLQARSERW
jgi:uncharacterized SAM-binding protein YcdF (DUF218 family)